MKVRTAKKILQNFDRWKHYKKSTISKAAWIWMHRRGPLPPPLISMLQVHLLGDIPV
jgi:hypothetical protein